MGVAAAVKVYFAWICKRRRIGEYCSSDLYLSSLPTDFNLRYTQMHDIVRDFTLASQANSGLEKLQRSFVSTLVAGVTSSKPSGNAAQATISTYASSSLAHHLRGTLSPPFAEDDLALKLLFHEAASVVTQA